ncbi:MAG: tetratricopeptide repeat protein [Rhodoferax sp.]|jgi:tetratricopeptide (TPR) repeat protein|nr:tetratricopeptide repeat protein [Rhodoferax sp.]
MKQHRSVLTATLRLLALVASLSVLPAQADDYEDVTQLLRSNQFASALTLVDRHLASKPADPQMRFLKGVILRNLGKPTEAIAIFTKLTDDYPELPEPYNNLAVLYANQGQFDKARMALEVAIRTNPSYATAHENIGDIYARLASQAYNKALQLDSGNAAVPPKLALIREIFKPNLGAARPAASAAVTTATPAPASKPEPVAVAAVVKPSAPAASPMPPVVAAKPAAAAADSGATLAAQAAVEAWAQAWSDKNMASYLGAYSPQFVPPGGQTRAAWEKDRHLRITGKSSISVDIADLKLAINGDKAVARFRQSYKANALNVSSRKTLELQKSGSRWLITKEATGN